MSHAGVEKPSGQALARRGLAYRVAGDEAVDGVRAGRGQPQDPQRRAPDQDPPLVRAPRRRIEDDPERRGQGAGQLAVIPASTGSTAPVMAALSGPHSHATRAATSSARTSRPS